MKSQFGIVNAGDAAGALEDSFPGISSYICNKAGSNPCTAVSAELPLEKFFSSLTDALQLNFTRFFGLLDLDIECFRQRSEIIRISEDFTDPHPNSVLGSQKNAWFTEMITSKIAPERYHVTFVSTQNWIDVSSMFSLQPFICFSVFG